MMDWIPNDIFDLWELFDTPREQLERSSNPMKDVPKTTTSLLNTREPPHSGRIVREPNWFTFLGETVSNELNLDSSPYNEAIFDKHWKN